MEKNGLSFQTKLLDKDYYTIDDLSKYFGVSQDLIVHFVKNGTIKTINKDNQRMLIPKKDFDQNARGMLEYLLSNPMGNKINPMRTSLIFGLGMGLGSWFVSGELLNFVVGAIIGFFVWFVLLILFGDPAMRIYKWVKEKFNKFN